jgi:hypothetical protein
MTGAGLTAAVARLVNRVADWTPSRWAASGRCGQPRAEVVHALVQRVADLAADAEGVPRRAVPRLANDLALADQLRVVAADLDGAGDPAALAEAEALVTAAGRAL